MDIRWVAGLQLFPPDVRVFIDRECEGGLNTTDQRVQPFLVMAGLHTVSVKCALWNRETVEVNLLAGERATFKCGFCGRVEASLSVGFRDVFWGKLAFRGRVPAHGHGGFWARNRLGSCSPVGEIQSRPGPGSILGRKPNDHYWRSQTPRYYATTPHDNSGVDVPCGRDRLSSRDRVEER